MCAAIMDNWFGIDRPTAPAAAPAPVIQNTTQMVANPNAASVQSDISPNPTSGALRAKKRGTSSLRIDRTQPTVAGSSGLNIPQA